MLEPVVITAKVTNALELLQIPYFIGGSVASTLYGMVRTTQGSDIIAELHLEDVAAFHDKLVEEFYFDVSMIFQAVTQNSSFNIIHRESFFKVDIFIPKFDPFYSMQLSRAISQTLSVDPPMIAQVASAEDIILAKLVWYRSGGEVSERQWRDVIGILNVQAGKLDFDYLDEWARKLTVIDLLERALREK